MFKMMFVVVFILFVSFNLSAGILFEPIVGYEKSQYDTDSDVDQTLEGGKLGLRVGATFGSPFIAVSAEMVELKYKTDDSTAEYDAKRTRLGVEVGFQPERLPVRVWVGYFPKTQIEFEFTGANTKIRGYGAKVGLGLTSLSYVNINIEGHIHTYNEYYSQASEDWVKSNESVKEQGVTVSLSVPLVL